MQKKNAKKLRSVLALCLCTAALFSCSGKPDTETGAGTTVTPPTEEKNEDPITLPDFDFYSLDKSKYIKLPEDTLTRDYREGLNLMGVPSDKTIEATVKLNYLKKLAKKTEVSEDAVVEDFDDLVMDYSGKLNDVAFEGGSASNTDHTVCIDATTFIDGFDLGLLGMKAGETKDLILTFPDPYPNNPSLAGKEVVFTVTVDKIIRYEYPALTDELVKENPDIFGESIDTAEGFVSAIKKQLSESYEKYDNELISNAAWEYLFEHSEILDYPADILSAYEDAILKSYERQAKNNQLTFDVYVVQQGYLSVGDFKEKVVTKTAKELVSEKLVMYSLADILNVTVTNEKAEEIAKSEYTEYIEPYISYYSMYYGIYDYDSYILQMGGLGAFRDNLIFTEVLNKLASESNGSGESDTQTPDTEAQ